MNKKIYGVAFFLVGALALIGAGCSQKTVVQDTVIPITPSVGEDIQKPESEQLAPKTTGEITDKQCIDVLAHQLWASQMMLYEHDMVATAVASQKAEALQEQYGINDDDFENICNAKIGDMDFMDKLEQRMKELGFVIE